MALGVIWGPDFDSEVGFPVWGLYPVKTEVGLYDHILENTISINSFIQVLWRPEFKSEVEFPVWCIKPEVGQNSCISWKSSTEAQLYN